MYAGIHNPYMYGGHGYPYGAYGHPLGHYGHLGNYGQYWGGAYGHHYGGYPHARHYLGHPYHFHANWGYDYNYYPNPDLLPKDEEEFRKTLPKYEVPILYSPGRFTRTGSPQRGSPRENSHSPKRKAILDR